MPGQDSSLNTPEHSRTGEAGPELAHALANRHVQLIAIGGAVGAGLFLGSGVAISRAGPALLIGYGAAGIVIFLMARALGELALYRPVAGAFSTYARELLGRRTGFITGWSYWLMWLLVGTAEITATGVFMRHWFPSLPQWIPALLAVVLLYTINMRAVKAYGELEYWFALIKVITIVGLLLGGLSILLFGFGSSSQTAHVSNLWRYGGFFPHGWQGVIDALPIGLFAFGGLEIIGLTAAETKDPEKALPRAINGVALRILIFYIGSLAMIMILYPWNALDSSKSPYVLVLQRLGFSSAADVINFVVITALLSSCNSGIFAGSRMLQSLAESGSAPRWLAPLNRRRVPGRCVNACAIVLLIGVALNYMIPDRIFGYFVACVSALLMWTWAVIMLCHLAYRRRVLRGEARQVGFHLPAAPYSNWLVLAFIGVVGALLALNSGSRAAYYSAGCWFAFLFLADAVAARVRARAVQGARAP